jgi:hypothetical protein
MTAGNDDRPMPWNGDPAEIACNFAAGNLGNNLSRLLIRDGRVHAETYVAMSGTIAGYAAQCSLFAADPAVTGALTVVTTASGRKFWFGEPLNQMLLARTPAESDARVWLSGANAAIAAGVAVERLPDLTAMFAHVASTIGGDKEGLPSVAANHQPQAPARDLLTLGWPFALKCFAAELDEIARRFGPVPKTWWGPVAAYAMARPILDVKEVTPPDVALTILMESAIYASKLHEAPC